MLHSEFIAKMIEADRFLQAYDSGSYKEVAAKFGVLPCVAATKIRFLHNHIDDPQCPWLGEFPHDAVMAASTKFRLSSIDAMREDLIRHFRIRLDGPVHSYPDHISKSLLVKLLTASGLKWFEHEGRPRIHWNEQATKAI